MKFRTFVTLAVVWDDTEVKDPMYWDWYTLVNSDGSPHPTPVRVAHTTRTLYIDREDDPPIIRRETHTKEPSSKSVPSAPSEPTDTSVPLKEGEPLEAGVPAKSGEP